MIPRTYINFLGKIEKLKCNTRHSYTSSGRKESVAEHSWRLSVMALLCADEYPDLDISKVIKMCLVHDFGEAVTGDIPAFLKNEKDEAEEEKAVQSILSMLPDDYKNELSGLFAEMSELKTDEAKLFKALDNLEAVLSHNEADISTWLPREYEENLTYGTQNCEWSQWTKRLREELKRDSEKKIDNNIQKGRNKMTEVYTLKIVYRNCDNKIWRTARVSSNSFLADLGYMVLATFDTLAYHLFNITVDGVTYELPNEDFEIDDDKCLFYVKISEFDLKPGDKFEMIYDFGCEQYFDFEVISVEPMRKGTGRAYPKIVEGVGRGILDDVPAEETLDIIRKIDKTGKSTHTYQTQYGDEIVWDYRKYDMKADNILLKGEIAKIADGYSYFEE